MNFANFPNDILEMKLKKTGRMLLYSRSSKQFRIDKPERKFSVKKYAPIIAVFALLTLFAVPSKAGQAAPPPAAETPEQKSASGLDRIVIPPFEFKAAERAAIYREIERLAKLHDPAKQGVAIQLEPGIDPAQPLNFVSRQELPLRGVLYLLQQTDPETRWAFDPSRNTVNFQAASFYCDSLPGEFFVSAQTDFPGKKEISSREAIGFFQQYSGLALSDRARMTILPEQQRLIYCGTTEDLEKLKTFLPADPSMPGPWPASKQLFKLPARTDDWVAGPDQSWFIHYDDALEAARKLNRKLFILKTDSDWCTYCISLQKDIFSEKKFQAIAAKSFIVLYLDTPRKTPRPDAQVKHNYLVSLNIGYERDGGIHKAVILNPYTEKELAQIEGYHSNRNYLAKVKEIAALPVSADPVPELAAKAPDAPQAK